MMRIRVASLLLVCVYLFGIVDADDCVSAVAYTIYDDQLKSGVVDLSWADHSLVNTAPVRSGKHSISWTPNDWNGIYFFLDNGFDTSKVNGISMWINGGGVGGQQFKFALLQGTTSVISLSAWPQPLITKILPSGIPAGDVWTNVVFDLSSVSPQGVFDGFWMQAVNDSVQPTLYIDDITVIGPCATPFVFHNLHFSNVFGDNMVLQREPQSARIWGWATSSTPVTLSMSTIVSGKTVAASFNCTASPDTGVWQVTIPPLPASGPYTFVVSAPGATSQKLNNIMFGDVFFCGGQSNMQMCVNATEDNTQQRLAAPYSRIRLFTVGTNDISLTPVDELLSIVQPWSIASVASVGNDDWQHFAGACWYFGKAYADAYPNVAVGLISASWGGTFIEAWSPPEVFEKCASTIQPGVINARSADTVEATTTDQDYVVSPDMEWAMNSDNFRRNAAENNQQKRQKNGNTVQNSVLYNAMVRPYERMALSGFLWWQGENNINNPDAYGCLFPAAINAWRKRFNPNYNLPWMFIQLHPWDTGGSTYLPRLRDSQQVAVKTLENVFYGSAIDQGDVDSLWGQIHARFKKTAAERALAAYRGMILGENIPYRGPQYISSSVISNSPVAAVMVFFESRSCSGGLKFRTTPFGNVCPDVIGPNNCEWYSLRLSDGNWYNATAAITSSKSITIAVTKVPQGLTVTGVSYAYSAWPIITLYNGAGIPAQPFRISF